MQTDFLVIGSGIAGLNFALEASKFGRVSVVTKKQIMESSTNYAQGGIAAVLKKTDSFEKHIEDTLKAGSFHNDKDAVRIMVEEGPELIRKLAEIGVPFQKKSSGEIALTREGGHSERRIAYCGDLTGQEIEKALVKEIYSKENIEIFENTFVTDLITKNSKVIGINILDENNKKIKQIFAKAVILASGGASQVYYPHTTNPEISTGDGIAMGILAGCKIKDMEFFQFHPTVLFKKGLPTFLLSESLRGEGALLRNFEGKEFIDKYDKRKELAPRDVVARAIVEEEKKGTVYLDMRHFEKSSFEKHFKRIYKTLTNYGLNPMKDLIPISPSAHYTIGGIEVDMFGFTGIERLYAFGEVTCTGVHGANRLGSNSLLEALVFSHRICQKLSKIIENKIETDSQNIEIKTTCELKKLREIRDFLTILMWNNAGIIRNMKDLKKGLSKIEKLEKKIEQYKCANRLYFETRNMILVSKKVVLAALKRKENLGTHFIEN